jgi:hypothetical protein
MGTWLAVKLWVCLIIARQFIWTDRDVLLAKRIVIVGIVVVMAVAALQLFTPGLVRGVFGAVERTRVGAPVITSVFRQPFQYAVFMLLAVGLIFSAAPARSTRIGFGVVAAGFAVLSLRLKALIDLILILAARLITAPSRATRVLTPIAVLAAVSAALYFASGLVQARLGVLFGGGGSPRQVLYSTAAAIAEKFAPLGSGFGSFGSEASRVYYSPVYQEYGLDQVYGFRPNAPLFITDASWATVLGEAGWLGVGGFALALGALAVELWRRLRTGPTVAGENLHRAAVLFLVPFIADSFTSPQLFSGFGAISLAVLVSVSASCRAPAVGDERSRAPGHGRPVGPGAATRRAPADLQRREALTTGGEST